MEQLVFHSNVPHFLFSHSVAVFKVLAIR